MTTRARITMGTRGQAGYQATAASQSFQRLAPVSVDYATRPIDEGFNWAECMTGLDTGRWYLVVFRSVRRATADLAMLTAYDDRAHEEAQAAPGLLYYFKGALCPARTCLSFCLWEDQRQAQQASTRPLHRAAMRIVEQMYDSYQLERYTVAKLSGRPIPEIVALPDGIMVSATDLPGHAT